MVVTNALKFLNPIVNDFKPSMYLVRINAKLY